MNTEIDHIKVILKFKDCKRKKIMADEIRQALYRHLLAKDLPCPVVLFDFDGKYL